MAFVAAPRAELKTAVTFAAGGLGPIWWELWPATGAATAAVLLATGAALGWRSVRRSTDVLQARALLLFLGGAGCLVACFATGRTGASFVNRYFALATPLWCVAFLAWPLLLRPALARVSQSLLLVVLVLCTRLNV